MQIKSSIGGLISGNKRTIENHSLHQWWSRR